MIIILSPKRKKAPFLHRDLKESFLLSLSPSLAMEVERREDWLEIGKGLAASQSQRGDYQPLQAVNATNTSTLYAIEGERV